MNLTEFIGFVVTLAAMIYLSVRQAREGKEQLEEGDEERESKSDVKKLLRTLNIDVPDEVVAPRLPPRPERKVHPASHRLTPPVPAVPFKAIPNEPHVSSPISEDLNFVNDMEGLPSAIPLDYHFPGKPSRVKVIVQSLNSPQDLLILHDLFGPPKGKIDRE